MQRYSSTLPLNLALDRGGWSMRFLEHANTLFFAYKQQNISSRDIVSKCARDKIEKIEMGGTCGTYQGRERCAQGFGGET